jgi:hypothetical protein
MALTRTDHELNETDRAYRRIPADAGNSCRCTLAVQLFLNRASVIRFAKEMKDFEPSNPFKKQPQNHGAATPPR